MYCECGCGKLTRVAPYNDRSKRWKKGEPIRFVKGHNKASWKGGRITMAAGYVGVLAPNHPRAPSGYVLEHVLIAETVLGKPLPPGVEVHHVDRNRSNNANRNLVICQDHAYHHLLHVRQTALDACGHADWRKCAHCKEWDEPGNLYIHPNQYVSWHQTCRKAYMRGWRNRSRTRTAA